MHQKEDQNNVFTRQIGWEKWRDPYGSDIMDTEWPGAFGTFETDELIRKAVNGQLPKDIEEIMEEEEEEVWNDEIEDELEESPIDIKQVKMGIMATPMGIIPITEHTAAGQVFNFWTAHTNFRMTQNILNIVDQTDGIESVDLFTPYRWRIAIGKVFDSSTVKNNVMRNLQAKPIVP